jgi:hypothetical protein
MADEQTFQLKKTTEYGNVELALWPYNIII